MRQNEEDMPFRHFLKQYLLNTNLVQDIVRRYFYFIYLVFYFILLFYFIFWPLSAACGILVPRPGIEPTPPALEAESLNHWTAREVPLYTISFYVVFDG